MAVALHEEVFQGISDLDKATFVLVHIIAVAKHTYELTNSLKKSVGT